jgi:hypothetical protein
LWLVVGLASLGILTHSAHADDADVMLLMMMMMSM